MDTLSGEDFLSLFLKPISGVKEDINKKRNKVKRSVQDPEKKVSNIDKRSINMSEEVSRMNEKTKKETLRVKKVSYVTPQWKCHQDIKPSGMSSSECT